MHRRPDTALELSAGVFDRFKGTGEDAIRRYELAAEAVGGFADDAIEFLRLAPREIDDYPKNRADKVPNGVEYEIKKMYYDTAHAGQISTVDALKDIVPVSQILYGSDVPIREYPLTDGPLDKYPHFSEDDWKAVNRGNSERLFPRLKSA